MKAIVTGAARGLGAGIAERLARDGGDVALTDVRTEVEQVAARISGLRPGGVITSFIADVSDEGACRRLVHQAVSALGGVTVLVNCAGIGGPDTEVTATPLAGFRRVLDVNLVGTFLLCREAAAAMIAGGEGGAIINIGSIFGQQGVPRGAGYCASKAGVTLLTQSMALELAPHGIRVNTVAPGNMATEMHWEELRSRAAADGTSFEAQVDLVRESVPLRRHGTPEDIAGAVAWLVSADSSYVTGQTIGVNGGVLLS
jgi:NAD(P)-dependent dehydrogenase (short-subunit alcohol dehydrogenase family)